MLTLLHAGFYIYIHAHTNAFIQRNFTHKQYSYSLYTHGNFLHRRFCTGKTEAFYTQKLLFREACKQSSFIHRSFYTHTKKTPSSLYTQQLLHTHTQKLLFSFAHTHTQAFPRRNFAHARKNFAQTVLHTAAFTQRSLYTDQLLHSEDFAHRRLYTKKL